MLCEKHSPKSISAIVVEPIGALYLNAPTFEKTDKAVGMELDPQQHQGETVGHGEGNYYARPGFLE